MTLEQFSILFVFEKYLMVFRKESKLDICMYHGCQVSLFQTDLSFNFFRLA